MRGFRVGRYSVFVSRPAWVGLHPLRADAGVCHCCERPHREWMILRRIRSCDPLTKFTIGGVVLGVRFYVAVDYYPRGEE